MVKTKELPKVLYTIAMEGKVAALAVLLMVDADRVNAPMALPRGTTLRSRVVETTVYDCVVREAMALGRIEVGQVGLNSCRANPDSSVNRSGERKAMLCAMELLQFFGAVSQGSCTDKRMVSPLISACEVTSMLYYYCSYLPLSYILLTISTHFCISLEHRRLVATY